MLGPGAYWIGDEELQEVSDVLKGGYLFRYGDPGSGGFKQKVYTFMIPILMLSKK